MIRRLGWLPLLLVPGLLVAQGITTAALTGAVTRRDGSPIAGAAVTVTHQGTGRRWETVTGSGGRFLLEDVSVGGPYRIEGRAIGFAPAARSGIVLSLGQRLAVDLALEPAPLQLPELGVTATPDPALDAGRTGPAEIIDATTIARLPNNSRDFLDLTLLSPQVAPSPSSVFSRSGGIVVGGQSRMANGFRVDGGLDHDLYRGGLPGRETLPRPISLEALQEIQVHAAPFDVRHAGFTGGLVNAVTRSGSNRIHGSAFVFLADRTLVGKNAEGDETGDFTSWQFGGSVSGPLVRDRAHYYLSLDFQRRTVADPGPLVTDTLAGADTALIGISYDSAARFDEILRDTYGLDPGTIGPVDGPRPAEDVFGKLSFQLGTNSHLEVSHHYRHGDQTRGPERRPGLYALSSVSQRNLSATHSSRLIWTSLLRGRWSNQLIVSYLRARDRCESGGTLPRITARAGGFLSAGPGARCPTDSFGQDVLEATEALTIGLGDHVVTMGVRGELLQFSDGVLVSSPGAWRFRSLDALEAGSAASYSRAFYGSADSGGVDFGVRQFGIYAQDRWTPAPGLTLTAGLRLDIPWLPDSIPTNEALQGALGVDTGELPGGLQWSPRLGINYVVQGEGRTFLRGGVGLFSGHPAYTWVGSGYHDSGRELFVSCAGPQVPGFDPVSQPMSCVDGGGVFPQLGFFDPDVGFPRTFKATIGLDQRLPGDAVATLDLLYTRGVDQLYLSDANLGPPVGTATGEAGRLLYGTLSPGPGGAVVTPTRISPVFASVVRVSNRSGDEAVSLSAQIRKRFGRGFEGGALYAYTRARDRMSFIVFENRGNLEFTPLDGTLEDRRLTTSVFEIPHRVHVYALFPLPWRSLLSLTYAGASGTPFTYVVDGDVNADGLGVLQPNDPVYVPASAAPGGDIVLVELDPSGTLVPARASEYARLGEFIEADPCLREHRGRLLGRNSCRNPWFGSLNARLAKTLPTRAGQSLELAVDLYNVLNLFNHEWGQYRVTFSNNPSVPMMGLAGYDTDGGRGVYLLALPVRNAVQDLESRWQMEVSVRYVF